MNNKYHNLHSFTYSDIPIKRKNRIEDKKSDEKNNDFLYGMNPFARPKKMSLLVRESVRSGAADNSPYYGTRKSGVWIPEAPGVCGG